MRGQRYEVFLKAPRETKKKYPPLLNYRNGGGNCYLQGPQKVLEKLTFLCVVRSSIFAKFAAVSAKIIEYLEYER